jgi:hypothetical protein
MQSFAGRLVIGLILAQGLVIGLRHLVVSVLLATQGEEAVGQNLQTLSGLILLESLQLVPLFLGGLLAGSGQRHGFVLGFLIGLGNSFLTMLSQVVIPFHASTLSWYGQPLLQACFGALGGWIGSSIWKPLAAPNLPCPSRVARKLGGARRRIALLAGRVAWVRVGIGAALAVAGTLWAEYLLQAVLSASGGRLEISTHLQDEIFTWEIKALAVLFGGALAGATTSNGFKQGLFVGVAASMVLLAAPRSHATLLVAALTVISTFSLSVAGGWFGSQLLPPVIPLRGKGRLGHSV